MTDFNVTDIFDKYATSVPLDVKNAIDLDQRYAIFANVWLITPNTVRQFLDEIQQRAEESAWEKIMDLAKVRGEK
jgi:hypothetical protein